MLPLMFKRWCCIAVLALVGVLSFFGAVPAGATVEAALYVWLMDMQPWWMAWLLHVLPAIVVLGAAARVLRMTGTDARLWLRFPPLSLALTIALSLSLVICRLNASGVRKELSDGVLCVWLTWCTCVGGGAVFVVHSAPRALVNPRPVLVHGKRASVALGLRSQLRTT